MRETCAAVLQEIEDHLEAYPMGATYFGQRAATYPFLVERLREGRLVGPALLDKARRFISERQREKQEQESNEQREKATK